MSVKDAGKVMFAIILVLVLMLIAYKTKESMTYGPSILTEDPIFSGTYEGGQPQFGAKPYLGSDSFIEFFDVRGNSIFKRTSGWYKGKLFNSARSMNIALAPNVGNRRVTVWAYREGQPDDTVDFHPVGDNPEHTYRDNPNMKLLADVRPGQRVFVRGGMYSNQYYIRAWL